MDMLADLLAQHDAAIAALEYAMSGTDDPDAIADAQDAIDANAVLIAAAETIDYTLLFDDQGNYIG